MGPVRLRLPSGFVGALCPWAAHSAFGLPLPGLRLTLALGHPQNEPWLDLRCAPDTWVGHKQCMQGHATFLSELIEGLIGLQDDLFLTGTTADVTRISRNAYRQPNWELANVPNARIGLEQCLDRYTASA